MRLLIFVGTVEAQTRYLEAGFVGINLAGGVKRFFDDPDAKAVAPRHWCTGWRAPADTLIAFDPSWPFERHAPETYQACMRVGNTQGDN